MKRMPTFVLVLLSSVSVSLAAPNFTLYYLDQNGRVNKIGIDAKGNRVGGAKGITSRGGYGCYRVAPDEKHVIGFVEVSRQKESDTGNVFVQWKAVLESRGGSTQRRTLLYMTAMPEPDVEWTPRGDHILINMSIFEASLDLYSAKTGKVVAEQLTSPPAISSDGRFLVTHQGSSESFLLIDLDTNQKTMVGSTGYPIVWIGKTHKLAWTNYGQGLWTGDVFVTESGHPVVANSRSLATDRCDDLQYIPGKGLLWLQGKDRSKAVAMYSSDLVTAKEGPRQPPWKPEESAVDKLKGHKSALLEYAEYSPDHRLIACPVRVVGSKVPEIRIFDRSGRSFAVARGKIPQWKGAKPWYK